MGRRACLCRAGRVLADGSDPAAARPRSATQHWVGEGSCSRRFRANWRREVLCQRASGEPSSSTSISSNRAAAPRPGSPVDAFRGTSASGAVVPAAVDVDHLSGDVIRRRGGEEGRNPGDICRGACVAGRRGILSRTAAAAASARRGWSPQPDRRAALPADLQSPDMLSTINPTPAKGSRGLVSRRAGGRSMPSNRQAYRVRWRCRRPRPGRVRGSRPGSA